MARIVEQIKALISRVTLKHALIGYAGVMTLVAAGLAVALVMSNLSHNESTTAASRKEKARDTQLALYDKPLTSPDGSLLIFPEVRLSIPATTAAKPLLYRFVDSAFGTGGATTAQSLSFASRTAIYNTAKPEGDERCNILAEIAIGKKFDKGSGHTLTLIDQKQLRDGRTIYIYINKASCAQEWGDLDASAMATLLVRSETYMP